MTLRSELDDITAIAVKVKGIGGLDSRFAEFLRDHGPVLLEAVACQEAITEQAAVTECISVTGRDPSDVIRDIIVWHVQMNASDPERGDK